MPTEKLVFGFETKNPKLTYNFYFSIQFQSNHSIIALSGLMFKTLIVPAQIPNLYVKPLNESIKDQTFHVTVKGLTNKKFTT